MKIYLASPFFNEIERNTMERVLKVLRNSGYEVFAPYEFIVPNAWDISNSEWGKIIFNGDVSEIDGSDVIVAINHGLRSDSGTAFEVGYAFAKNKKIFVVYFDENLDSLMINNATTGMICFKDFEKNDILNLNDYVGKFSKNEVK